MNTASRINQALDKIHPLLWHLICIVIALIFFSAILLNRSPNPLRPLSLSMRTGFGLVIPLTALFIYIAFRARGQIGQLFGITAVLSLFGLSLAGLWASGQTQTTVLNGLIPLVDAGSYYMDAIKLMNGQNYSLVSSRRPFFTGLLATFLSLTNYNLMASLAILTAIVGIACYFMAKEIQRTHGPEVAIFTLMIVFLFYRMHSGVAMTENLGVAFGVLGFGLLWRGAADLRFSVLWVGLFITSMALNARAGAFFMLPLLVLWAAWLLQKNMAHFLKLISLGVLAIFLGFVCNGIITRLLGVSDVIPFGNFSYTIYGLAAGGKSWSYVFQAHPEVMALPEPHQTQRIYLLAFELMRENPWQTLKGALFNWSMLFSDTWYNVYSYVGGETWKVNILARWGMYLLSMLGVIAWMRDPRDPVRSLVMISILGILISVPFLPPTDAYRMRPYAASIVVLAALPALGLKFILERIPAGFFKWDPGQGPTSAIPITAFSFILVFVTLAGPILIRYTAQPLNFNMQACTTGPDLVVIRYAEGTYINIKKQNLFFIDWMPDFHVGQFRSNAHSLVSKTMIDWAEAIEPARTILFTMDYNQDFGVMVVAPSELLPAPGSLLQMCGQFQENVDPRIFHAQEIHVLSQ